MSTLEAVTGTGVPGSTAWERGGGTCACFRDCHLCICSFCPFGCWCTQFGKNALRMKEGTKRQCCWFYMLGYCFCLGIPPMLLAAAMRDRLQKRAGLPASDGMVRNFICHLICPWCSIAEEARVLDEMDDMRAEELEERGGGTKAPSEQLYAPSEESMSRGSDEEDDEGYGT